jgi:glycosyltransferase involved in cell wall biosynthesis
MKKKVGVIGFFGLNQDFRDGQTVKTRIITQEIEKYLGAKNVKQIDTYNWKKHPVRLLKNSVHAVHWADHVIFMTDEGGIKVFPWLLRFAGLFTNCALHYVVVGGWLIHFLKKHAFIRACLRKFTGIYVETSVMKQALEALGFDNIVLMPNCKPLTPVAPDLLTEQDRVPFRFCTFSRVMQEKGIDDAVDAVRGVNARYGKTVCTLDIFGQVDPVQTAWFEDLQKTFPAEVRYCGVINYDQSVEVLKDYFALLFPTEFFTEGVPGTIIDAYAAGVPVVAARWESFTDVVDDGITGIGYPFGKQACLAEVIMSIVDHPELVSGMKKNCLQKAEQYLPDNVMDILFSRLS